jgi:hypothetical protein
LKFIDPEKRVLHTDPFKEIFIDLDGTLAGQVNASVTYARWFNEWPECRVDTAGTYDYGSAE